MHSAYANNALGIWELNDGSGSAPQDISGAGRHGSFSGTPQWTAGPSGGALSFDGNSYVSVPDLRSSIDLVGGANGKILLMTWVKPTQYVSGGYSMIANGFPGFLYFGVNPSRRLQLMINAGGNHWPQSNATIPLDKWTHIAFLLEGGVGYKFYIDGKLDKEVSLPSASIIDMGGVQTAFARSWQTLPSEYWVGQIDSLRVYYPTLE